MKRILAALVISAFLTGSVYAETNTDDMTAQDFSALRKKLSRIKHEMDLLMKDVISNASTASDAVLSNFGADVNVDILQNDKDVIVKADLPGMDKDKINISLEGGRMLKISGTREITKKESSPGMVRQERFFGNFEKVIDLPSEVMNSGISATYNNGVLEITMPKKTKTKEETVNISVK